MGNTDKTVMVLTIAVAVANAVITIIRATR